MGVPLGELLSIRGSGDEEMALKSGAHTVVPLLPFSLSFTCIAASNYGCNYL
jgi:hypothetical protein